MSDNNTGQSGTPAQTSQGDDSQQQQKSGARSAQTGDGGQQQQPGNQQNKESGPYAVFNDGDSFNKRMDREARSRMDRAAKELGYESWEQMTERTAAITKAVNPQVPRSEPETPRQTGPDLALALQVAQEKGLPVAMVRRLQGATKEEMEADADALMALLQPAAPPPHQPPTGPGVPSAPTNSQTVTFTRAQLQDAKFVRENKDAIMRAAREGRIVES